MRQSEFIELINKWHQEHAITAEQAQYMRSDVQQVTSEKSGTRFVAIIGSVGAAVLVAGMLLLISANWESLGKPVQLFLALIMPVVPICLAYYMLLVRRSTSILVRVANVFGVGLIGGSLAIIGQIYNLEANYVSFLTWWTVLSLPFIFIFRRVENVAISTILLGATLWMALVDFIGTRDEETLVLSLTVSALAYAAASFMLGSAFRQSVVWSDSARFLRLFSAAIASGTLFVTTFEFYARLITDSGRNDVDWIPISIVFNLVFIGFLVFVLMRALRYQEEGLVVTTVRFMFLYVMIKYFTLFDDIFGTGLLLLVGGILFIGGAWYLEKNKHILLRTMRQDTRQSEFHPGNVTNNLYE